jgi:SAM-dependent methyltransferase
MAVRIAHDEGRELFGCDPAAYDRARPAYPARVYEILVDRCGLRDGCRTLEVGAGSGLATRRLVELGARPLVAVEPDGRFREALESLARISRGTVLPVFASFESADLEAGTFDLAVCASSFHWLDREAGPLELGACLRPGGWLALFWNVFGDPRQPDPFHEATASLLSDLAASPSRAEAGSLPFALDHGARAADFGAAHADHDFTFEEISWTLTLSPARVRSLYATWASIVRLPHARRESLLEQIESIAEDRFDGVVERRMVTSIYVGRRAR